MIKLQLTPGSPSQDPGEAGGEFDTDAGHFGRNLGLTFDNFRTISSVRPQKV